MRAAALLVSLAMAGAAHAAPASPAEVDRLMRALQLDADSSLMERVHAKGGAVATFEDAGQQRCVDRQVRQLTSRLMAESLTKKFGAEGDRIVAEWIRFLETPSGALFVTAMKGSSNEAELMAAAMDADELARGDAFVASDTGRRLLDALNIAGEVDDSVFQESVQRFKEDCHL